jgi:hypothetical protein
MPVQDEEGIVHKGQKGNQEKAPTRSYCVKFTGVLVILPSIGREEAQLDAVSVRSAKSGRKSSRQKISNTIIMKQGKGIALLAASHRGSLMDPHRFRETFATRILPGLSRPPVNFTAFCACPVGLFQGVATPLWLWQQQYLYQLALDQAEAVVRPSLPERDLLGYWN